MPISYSPDLIALNAEISELPPVAQPLATLIKGMPVSPSSFTSASALPALALPPNANWISRHSYSRILQGQARGVGALLQSTARRGAAKGVNTYSNYCYVHCDLSHCSCA